MYLICEGIVYPQALNSLFSVMVEQEAAKGKRYRVDEGDEDGVGIDASQFGKQNVSALYLFLSRKHGCIQFSVSIVDKMAQMDSFSQ